MRNRPPVVEVRLCNDKHCDWIKVRNQSTL